MNIFMQFEYLHTMINLFDQDSVYCDGRFNSDKCGEGT
ncbi:hypothetical protein MY1_1299 [Nitrosarchaeum koreense MY1]|uniref:Uncharacterized protein n=1 Tax=Nitrosarchaeum koreense MY1 TaxID=1001994 RepID=F9CXU1_9ARCH|nr:hypothetical protein MY1_1299 [Nitrosarchaeum koreense MY1]